MNVNDDAKKNVSPKNSGEGVRVIEEIVEGFWDCTNCNAKNRGSAQQCDACGAVRSENVKFYVEDVAESRTDEACTFCKFAKT